MKTETPHSSAPDALHSVRPDGEVYEGSTADTGLGTDGGDAGPDSGETEPLLRPCGVLVVEADPDLQWRLARALTVEGNRVVGTSSGDGALALVAEWPVDLVLVAEELPRMEGIEVIRHLHERCPDVVSILIADENTPELRAAARLAGASTCVRKPRDLHQLVSVIGSLRMPPGVRSPVRETTPETATDAAE